MEMNQRLLSHEEVRAKAESLGLPVNTTEQHPWIPAEDASYKFRYDLVLEMLMFFTSGIIGMKLMGYQGSGKTSLVSQFHAALGYPLLKVVMTSRTEPADLIAKLSPSLSGGFEVKTGPLVQAAETGVSILIDEYNVGRPETLVACNGLLEASPQFVEEIDRVVTPVAGFRVFGCCNPADKSLGFLDRNTQDPSNDERFGYTLWVPYPTPEQEIPIITDILQRVVDSEDAGAYAARFVKVANDVRDQYMGETDGDGALEVTLSLRALRDWATITTIAWQAGSPRPVSFALERAVLSRLPRQSPSREAIKELVATQFGEVVTP